MKHWKKRCRGAISVFLIIILVANIMLVGVLVDAGRFRMAKASAEMALDSATGSILSYYNQLVYDLYGLFATDSLSEEAIGELLNDYVVRTLSVTEADESTTTALASALKEALHLSSDTDLPLFDGYEFDLDVTMENYGTKTLADTDMAMYQIIEHMKYRAPVEIISGGGSFLKKLNGLTAIIDRVKAATDKAKTRAESGAEERAESTAGLLEEIDAFDQDVLDFTIDPTGATTGYDKAVDKGKENIESNAKDLRDFVDAADRELERLSDEWRRESAALQDAYEEAVEAAEEAAAKASESEDEEDDDSGEDLQATLDRLAAQHEQDQANLKEEYHTLMSEACRTELISVMENIQTQAETLYNRANDIRDKVDKEIAEYESYINTLEVKMGDKPSEPPSAFEEPAEDPDKLETSTNDQNLKTVYLPEIELAKSTCGELLKNIDLVLMSRQNLKSLYAFPGDPSYLEMIAESVINKRLGDPDSPMTVTIGALIDRAANKTEGQENATTDQAAAENLKLYFSGTQEDMDALNVFARKFEDVEQVKIKTDAADESDAGSAAQKGEDAAAERDGEETPAGNGEDAGEDGTVSTEEEEAEGVRDLEEEDLTIDPAEDQDEWDMSLSTTVDDEDTASLMENGLKLLEGLATLLESARDSLYINEYAVAYFPNYVQHYKAPESPLATLASNTYLKDEPYANYSATQAELEYIVTGQADAVANVAAMSARLLGFRTLLNVAAIFTDTAKVTQANTLAVSISGPFAPIISFALLVAWAVAESALDVVDLMDGKDVVFFKQGASWQISVEGILQDVIGKVVEEGVDLVTDKAKEVVEDASAAVTQVTNTAIYTAYDKVKSYGDTLKDNLDSAVNGAVESGQKVVTDWSGKITEAMEEELNEVGGETLGKINTATGGAVDELTSTAKDQLNGMAKDMADAGAEVVLSTYDQVTEAAINKVEDAADQAILKVNGKIQDTVDHVTSTINEKIDTLNGAAKEKLTGALNGAIDKYVPKGTVVNTGGNEDADGEKAKFSVTLNYMDYMRIFLMFTSNEKKVQRMQSLIQANIRYSEREGKPIEECEVEDPFTLSECYGSIGAKLTGSIGFMLMGEAMIPKSVNQDGRMVFTVYSNRGY